MSSKIIILRKKQWIKYSRAGKLKYLSSIYRVTFSLLIKTYPSLKVTESLTICLCLFETIFGQKRFLKYKHNLFSKRYFQSIQMQTPLAKKGCYFIRIFPFSQFWNRVVKNEIWNVCSCYLATLNRRFIPYFVSNRK